MKKALPLVLLGGAILLFCIGVAALGARFFFPQSSSVDLNHWQTPLAQVDNKRLIAANSLEILAGTDESQAIDDALQQGDWESAFAGVAYTPDLSDASRAGTLLLLGSRYAAIKQTAKAAWCYEYAVTLAQVSPVPSDLVRAQTLLEAAQGLHALQLDAAARTSVDQAYLIAEYSTTLPQDAQARILDQISQLYRTLNVANLATEARQKSDEASNLKNQVPASDAHVPYQLQLGTLPASKDVQDAMTARTAAAKDLIDSLNLHPPKTAQDLPQDLISALGDKLTAEDGVRQSFYDAQSQPSADPSVQAAVLQDKIGWLALKLRVARGAFGLDLVPEWDPDASKIASDLSDSLDELFKLTEQQAAAATQAATADSQLQDTLRAELVAGRWGLYAYDENDLRSRLGDVTSKLRDDQVPSLRLDTYQNANLTYYLLVPDELYGQGVKALPR